MFYIKKVVLFFGLFSIFCYKIGVCSEISRELAWKYLLLNNNIKNLEKAVAETKKNFYRSQNNGESTNDLAKWNLCLQQGKEALINSVQNSFTKEILSKRIKYLESAEGKEWQLSENSFVQKSTILIHQVIGKTLDELSKPQNPVKSK